MGLLACGDDVTRYPHVGLDAGTAFRRCPKRRTRAAHPRGSRRPHDTDAFERVGTFTYQGEGWGLCYDGQRLYMSDGSATLTVREPRTFEALGTVAVTLGGSPMPLLNELECARGALYANVWQTNAIVEIDKASGRVTSVFDASGLLSEAEAAEADVLNGIAYDPARDTFFITDKLWPKLFEVRLPQ